MEDVLKGQEGARRPVRRQHRGPMRGDAEWRW